jgi:hypothetical protein
MTTFRKALFIAAGLALGVADLAAIAAANASAPAVTAAPAVYRDGAHDFDFNIGTWRTHIQTREPFSTSDWKALTGTVTVRKIWGGKASMEEIEAGDGNDHFEGLTLFLYNPQSHQWNQTWVSSSDGTIDGSAFGEFKNGRGELIQQDTYQGRSVLVRTVWSDIQPNSHHFEQSYSSDNGKTWLPNFEASLTRISQ